MTTKPATGVLIALLSIAAAAACFAQGGDPSSDVDFSKLPKVPIWSTQVEMSESEFDKDILIKGRTNASKEERGSTESFKEWRLVSFVNKSTGSAEHWILFSDRYDGTGWKIWDTASTDSAETLKVVKSKQQVGSCSRYGGCIHLEEIGVILTADTLKRAASEKVRIRVSGKSSPPMIITLDPQQVAYQLQAADFKSAEVKSPSTAR